MSKWADAHAPDETLEMYAMGKLSGEELDTYEEHLLICDVCQDRQKEFDEFVQAARIAGRRILNKEVARELANQRSSWFFPVFPRVAGAVALAAAIIVAIWLPGVRTGTEPMPVANLQAMRSLEGGTGASIPSGKPFILKASVRDLPSASTYRVEIVSADGRLEWASPTTADAGLISLSVPVKLSAGKHWVRLYNAPAEGELLREFGLDAK